MNVNKKSLPNQTLKIVNFLRQAPENEALKKSVLVKIPQEE